MSTPDALAKSAREKLAIALNALQTTADPPVALLDLAESIAQTMGILHRIERSRGQDLSGRETVLTNIRTALNVLQNMEEAHPAVDAVMEQVAGCLSSAHQLSRIASPSAPGGVTAPVPGAGAPAPVAAAPVVPVAAAPVVPVAAAPVPVAAAPKVPASPVAQMVANIPPPPAAIMSAVAPQPVAQHAAPPAGFPQSSTLNLATAATVPDPARTAPTVPDPARAFPAVPGAGPNHTLRIEDGGAIRDAARQAAPQVHTQPPPTQPLPPVAAQPVAPMQPVAAQPVAPMQPVAAQPVAPMQPVAAQPAYQPPPQAAPQPARSTPVMQAQPAAQPAGRQGSVVVGLGAHSVSNFYKGLGGNDVIEYGGIFVSTYQIPKIGTPVNLLVKLPGDLEFQASGVVQWIREASGDGVDPGFGARFTQITPEGRQLVYRYTRNREPILYDDL